MDLVVTILMKFSVSSIVWAYSNFLLSKYILTSFIIFHLFIFSQCSYMFAHFSLFSTCFAAWLSLNSFPVSYLNIYNFTSSLFFLILISFLKFLMYMFIPLFVYFSTCLSLPFRASIVSDSWKLRWVAMGVWGRVTALRTSRGGNKMSSWTHEFPLPA